MQGQENATPGRISCSTSENVSLPSMRAKPQESATMGRRYSCSVTWRPHSRVKWASVVYLPGRRYMSKNTVPRKPRSSETALYLRRCGAQASLHTHVIKVICAGRCKQSSQTPTHSRQASRWQLIPLTHSLLFEPHSKQLVYSVEKGCQCT